MARYTTSSRIRNCYQHAFRIVHDIMVGDAEHQEPALRKLVIPQTVLAFIVSVAVDFEDEGPGGAHEVRNEWADHFLPPEFEAIEPAVRKIAPQPKLGLGRIAAHFSCALVQPIELVG